MRSQVPDLSVLTEGDCLIAFAAMALCCDNTVRDHEMGYHQGGGTAYITAKGVTRRTGLSRTAAEHALRRLETAGVAKPAPDSTGWRTVVLGWATSCKIVWLWLGSRVGCGPRPRSSYLEEPSGAQ
jgi:hypothetical protein